MGCQKPVVAEPWYWQQDWALRFQIYSLDFWASCSSPRNVESWREACVGESKGKSSFPTAHQLAKASSRGEESRFWIPVSSQGNLQWLRGGDNCWHSCICPHSKVSCWVFSEFLKYYTRYSNLASKYSFRKHLLSTYSVPGTGN